MSKWRGMREKKYLVRCEGLPANLEADGFRAKFAKEAQSRKDDAWGRGWHASLGRD